MIELVTACLQPITACLSLSTLSLCLCLSLSLCLWFLGLVAEQEPCNFRVVRPQASRYVPLLNKSRPWLLMQAIVSVSSSVSWFCHFLYHHHHHRHQSCIQNEFIILITITGISHSDAFHHSSRCSICMHHHHHHHYMYPGAFVHSSCIKAIFNPIHASGYVYSHSFISSCIPIPP